MAITQLVRRIVNRTGKYSKRLMSPNYKNKLLARTKRETSRYSKLSDQFWKERDAMQRFHPMSVLADNKKYKQVTDLIHEMNTRTYRAQHAGNTVWKARHKAKSLTKKIAGTSVGAVGVGILAHKLRNRKKQ